MRLEFQILLTPSTSHVSLGQNVRDSIAWLASLCTRLQDQPLAKTKPQRPQNLCMVMSQPNRPCPIVYSPLPSPIYASNTWDDSRASWGQGTRECYSISLTHEITTPSQMQPPLCDQGIFRFADKAFRDPCHSIPSSTLHKEPESQVACHHQIAPNNPRRRSAGRYLSGTSSGAIRWRIFKVTLPFAVKGDSSSGDECW